MSSRQELEAELHSALAESQFELHYQPQIAMSDGACIGVEALLRWRHPQHGLVAPPDFIVTLESMPLMVDVGRWVIEEASRQVALWKRSGLGALRMAVNISPAELAADGLFDAVQAAIASHQIAADQLELELIERSVVDSPERCREVLHELRKLGVRAALDDFGVGYSALARLRKLEVDTLKIDRSFTAEALTSQRARAIVAAMAALGQSLDMTIVGEGVETRDQYCYLRNAGCSVAQGYWIGRPSSAAKFEEWLRDYPEQRRSIVEPGTSDPGVLIVEDEDDFRHPLARTLRRRGYRVLEARSVAEAIECIHTHRGDLEIVLTDVRLPDGTGMSILEQVEMEQQHLRFVVMTGMATMELAILALQRGAVDFLRKPFTNEALETALERALHGSLSRQLQTVERG